MKIDIEYVKNILDTIHNHDKADFTIRLFDALWGEGKIDENHKFVFHLEILHDQGFLVSTSTMSSVGIRRSGSEDYVFSIVPLRLSAKGHEYAAALNKPEVFKILKEKFNNEGPVEFMKAH